MEPGSGISVFGSSPSTYDVDIAKVEHEFDLLWRKTKQSQVK